MPTFFFHVRSGEIVAKDDEGVVVSSPQEAVLQGFATAREIALKDGIGERFLDTVMVEVVDEQEVVWARIPLKNATDHQLLTAESNAHEVR